MFAATLKRKREMSNLRIYLFISFFLTKIHYYYYFGIGIEMRNVREWKDESKRKNAICAHGTDVFSIPYGVRHVNAERKERICSTQDQERVVLGDGGSAMFPHAHVAWQLLWSFSVECACVSCLSVRNHCFHINDELLRYVLFAVSAAQ